MILEMENSSFLSLHSFSTNQANGSKIVRRCSGTTASLFTTNRLLFPPKSYTFDFPISNQQRDKEINLNHRCYLSPCLFHARAAGIPVSFFYVIVKCLPAINYGPSRRKYISARQGGGQNVFFFNNLIIKI